MQDQSDDDHEGEEDVERKRNRKVRKSGPDFGGQFRGLVDEDCTRYYIVDVSPEHPRRFMKDSNAHPKSQGT